jgi:post-segregation antitoxin (ccd killing protein)
MSDKQVTIELPEELVNKAAAAQIDMRAVMEKALLLELAQRQTKHVYNHEKLMPMTMEEKLEYLRQVLAPERLEQALRDLEDGTRTPGLWEGQIWASDDFDDPLPDEFWGDLFQ